MKEISGVVRGTRIQVGNTFREVTNNLITILKTEGFEEIILPVLDSQETYNKKLSEEKKEQMYLFNDKKGRNLCLRPEGTATIQQLATTYFKFNKDLKLFYLTPCFRYERPQKGRYREFYQLGVEIINPTSDYKQYLIELSEKLLTSVGIESYIVDDNVKRGLGYYIDKGFEISINSLGAQKQVVGGGKYDEGIGFAIGVDRLMLVLGR